MEFLIIFFFIMWTRKEGDYQNRRQEALNNDTLFEIYPHPDKDCYIKHYIASGRKIDVSTEDYHNCNYLRKIKNETNNNCAS